jgi:hypothetical protein
MEQNTAVAAPKNNVAKFVFLYLLELVSLGFMTVSFGIILFQMINKNIADTVTAYSGSFDQGALKFAISALLVSTPIFYVVGSFIQKSLFSGELKKDSGVRRWLTYLILFVSFLIFVGWLIAFVYNFLNGEVTMKFILKTLSVLVIAGTVFGFYLYDIRREAVENIKDKVLKIFFISTLSAVVIVFAASFFVVEPPAAARDRLLDGQIINSFGMIYQCVDQYYRDKNILPGDFAAIQSDCSYLTADNLRDTQTGTAFAYTVLSTTTYEICANFRTSNLVNNNYAPAASPAMIGSNSTFHDKGYQCLKNQIYPAVKPN